VEYKTGARVDLHAGRIQEEPLVFLPSIKELPVSPAERVARAEREPATPTRRPEPAEPEPEVRVEAPRGPGQAVPPVTITAESGTGVTAKLPYEIRMQEGSAQVGTVGDNEVRDGRLMRGWFAGPLTDDEGGLLHDGAGTEPVEFFHLPTDPSKIMVQLRGHSTQARSSMLRNVINSVRTMKQYEVLDDRNQQYIPAGYFAVVTRSGNDYFELHYYPDPAEQRGMLIWLELSRSEMNQAKDVGLIFLVDPGPRRLERFSGTSRFFQGQNLLIDIPARMPEE
jgi:hypothetical protein